MNRKVILLLSLFSLTEIATAQDSMIDKFSSFSRNIASGYNSFRDDATLLYADFLRTSWVQFKSMPSIGNPRDQKTPPIEYDGSDDRHYSSVEVPYTRLVCNTEPSQPVVDIEEHSGDQQYFEFSCLGLGLKVRVPEQNSHILSSLETADISEAWKILSDKKYNNLILDFLAIRQIHNLSDWAYLQAIQCFTGSFNGSKDAATLLSAYIFARSGYKMRLGMDENRLYLLFGTEDIIYGKPYFKIDGYNYYALEGGGSDMFIANFAWPDERSLSMHVGKQSLGEGGGNWRKFTSKRYGITAECSTGKARINFFSTYPASQPTEDNMTRWARYANAPIDESTSSQLYTWLKFAILGKSSTESADMLLDFVQTAFQYKQDEEVWGEDRIFFAEETLFYPSCDCEDRAILFTRLVRDLLGLEVALVYYPEHLAAAVRFPEGADGDSFLTPDGEYTICDPSYIGAPIGKTMPGMDNSQAKLLLL